MTPGSELSAVPPSKATRQTQAKAGPEEIGLEENDLQENGPVYFMDESARKREALGLSPRRPTAPAAPMRPPDETSNGRLKAWTLVGLVTAMIVGTILLVLARIAGSPTDWPTAVAGLMGRPIVTATDASASSSGSDSDASTTDGSATTYDFASAESVLPSTEHTGAYTMTQLPDAGVYRVQIEPGNVAWVMPGPACTSPYRLMAGTVIDADTPDSFAGLLGRYQDGDNFYLFAIDGLGNFAVLLLKDGVWQPVQAGAKESIHPAGERNTLALGDDGTTMVFVVNDEPIHRVDIPQLPLGLAGFGGRAGERMAQIDVTGVELMSACQ